MAPKPSSFRARATVGLAAAVAAALLWLGSSIATAAAADGDRSGAPQVEFPVYDYDHRFTFARIKFSPIEWGFSRRYTWGLDLKWNHDYPQAEQNFAKVLDEITGIKANPEGGNLIELDDPRLFDYPWAYLCEPGFWDPTETELVALRNYLLRGGFLVIDDFFDQVGGFNEQWDNFERQIRRLFPGSTLSPLRLDQAAFRVFFELDDLDFSDPRLPFNVPAMYGIFEDNDPTKRLMIAVNYNMDIGDYWEWSDQGLYPVNMTEKGFRLGLNYLLYSMTH